MSNIISIKRNENNQICSLSIIEFNLTFIVENNKIYANLTSILNKDVNVFNRVKETLDKACARLNLIAKIL